MSDPMPEPAHCDICGCRLQRNNTTGVCRKTTPECSREYEARRRRAAGIPARRKGRSECEYPGCPMAVNSDGWCATHGDRVRKTGSPEPDGMSRQYVPVHSGEAFGFWIAVEDSDPRNSPVLCRCRCGLERRIWPSMLHAGETRSCGCGRLEFGMATRRAKRQANPYMRAGERYAMMTTLEDALVHDAVIACGNQKPCVAGWLRRGAVRSCGCTRSASVSAAMTKHGLTGHPLYPTWLGMIQRVTDPRSPGYRHYGGRGIRIHEPWLSGPTEFIAWVTENLGPRPDGHTLDRKDNDGNYEPGNLRWASAETQTRNRRTISVLAARIAELEAELAALRS
jgi:hypothetical protein